MAAAEGSESLRGGMGRMQPSKESSRIWPESSRYRAEVSRAYLQLQINLRNSYLDELLNIEKLCVQLNVLQKDNVHMKKLKEMQVRHIRPLISRLQSPKSHVIRTELAWLIRMSKLLPPFLEEFHVSLTALRKRSKSNMLRLLNERVTAAAA